MRLAASIIVISFFTASTVETNGGDGSGNSKTNISRESSDEDLQYQISDKPIAIDEKLNGKVSSEDSTQLRTKNEKNDLKSDDVVENVRQLLKNEVKENEGEIGENVKSQETNQTADVDTITVMFNGSNNEYQNIKTEEIGIEISDNDLHDAAEYGIEAMNNLYYEKEPQLYAMGLYLKREDPARYVAAFNAQSDEARRLAQFGYAALEGATMFMKKYPNVTRGLTLLRNAQRTALQRQCPNRGTPQCPPASLRYRTSDGSCNNLQHLWWGSAMSTMQRFLSPVYHDGLQSVRRAINGKPLPSARDVSSLIHQDRDVPLASVTHMLMQWGQFVDHDITATGQSRSFNGSVPQCCLSGGAGFQPPEFMHPECLPISIKPRDPFFGPLKIRCLEFVRSGPAPREDCSFGPREQLTQVTSYIDASTVYSSNAFQSDSLRIFRNGLLQYGKLQSRRPVLPRDNNDLCKRGSLSSTCFKAGDGRISEQPALTSLHVVFLRLHNRIATKLAAMNFHWSDEKIFQETRKIVGAIVQHVTYREFLPIVLGPDVMKVFDLEILKSGYYDKYNDSIDATIANAFSTAAYRFGHSMVQQSFVRFDSNHRPLQNNVTIHEEFSNPTNLETAGSVDRIILGLVNQPSQKRDEFMTEELTNHLFQTPNFRFGMDLAALNIQRGRDHGIPPYVQWRQPCGLSQINNFDDLEKIMSVETARKLRFLYSSVADIDLFAAGLAETSISGGLVGPTFACIIAQQFGNFRRGDRFWYENSDENTRFTPDQLQQIKRITLSQVLCETMDNIETIQPFVFLTPDKINNQRVSCDDDVIGRLNLDLWRETESEFRSNLNNEQTRRKISNKLNSSPKIVSGSDDLKLGNNNDKSKIFSPGYKPVKASIHQVNRIFVRKPLGPPNNVTINVQNNAVNAPIFVNDAVYGSSVLSHPTTSKYPQAPVPHPPPNFVLPTPISHDPIGTYPGLIHIPGLRPEAQPIPTSIPQSVYGENTRPQYMHRYDDPNNPNPVNAVYGLMNGPANGIIYDGYPGSSPRPTLYTYYTNAQRPTTPTPGYQYGNNGPQYDRIDYNRPTGYYQPGPSPVWPSNKPLYGGPHPQRPSYNNEPLFPMYPDNPVWKPPQQYPHYETNQWNRPTNFERPNRPNYHNYQSHHPYQINEPIPVENPHPYPYGWSSDSYYSKPVAELESQMTPSYLNDLSQYTRPDKRPNNDRITYTHVPSYDNTPTNKYDSFSSTSSYHVQGSYKLSTKLPESYHQGTVNSSIPHYIDSGSYTAKPIRNPEVHSSWKDEYKLRFTPNPKPGKIHSVTVLTERPILKQKNEVPRPLKLRSKNGGLELVRKPGQYYYENNILYQYPYPNKTTNNTLEIKNEEINSELEKIELKHPNVSVNAESFMNDTENNTVSTTITTMTETNENNNIYQDYTEINTTDSNSTKSESVINDDTQESYIKDSTTEQYRDPNSTNFSIESNTSSILTKISLFQPVSNSTFKIEEIPKPIKLRSHGT